MDPESRLIPRKLPRQHRAAVTIAAIVEAAARILDSAGTARLTTTRIAEVAGVSIGSLYQYFPHRDAIIAALIAREQARRASNLAGVINAARELPLEQGVAKLVAAGIAQDDGPLGRLLDAEELRLPLGEQLECARTALDREVARFITWHFPDQTPAAVLRLARSLRLIAQALIDGWAGHPAAAEEACDALLGYLDRAANTYPQTPFCPNL